MFGTGPFAQRHRSVWCRARRMLRLRSFISGDRCSAHQRSPWPMNAAPRFSPALVSFFWLTPFLVLALWPNALMPARAGVLFDFSLLCLLLTVARMHKLLWPLLLLPIAASIVQLGNWIFTGQLIDVYTLMTFTATNVAESSGFAELLVESHLHWLIAGVLALAAALWGGVRGVGLPARSLLLISAMAMTLHMGLLVARTQQLPSRASDVARETFYGHVAGVASEFHRRFLMPEVPPQPIADMVLGGTSVDAILVVIGESTTTYRMSAYGYERDTTPHIADADILFKNLVSVGLNTQPNVQAMTTGDVGIIEQAHDQDVFRVARQAGYVSHYIDNNRYLNRDPMYLIAKQADAYDSVNGIGENSARNDHKIQHDDVVVPLFKAALERNQGKRRVFFVHLVGSHFNHDLRYPPAFKRFPSHYDNAVRYTDHIVQALHSEFMARTRGQTAMMIYVSDHGVKLPPGCGMGAIPQDEIANYGNDERFHSNMSVPLAVWFNPELREAQTDRIASMAQSSAKPIDQRFLMWTLADAMGVTRINGHAVEDMSLFSSTANYLPRRNSRGEDIDALLARGDICRP